MLSDEKVRLRALEQDDLERTWRWINDPTVYEAVGLSVPISRHAQERWYEGLAGNTSKRVLAVCRADDDTHVGNVSLDQIEPVHRTARLSVFLGDPNTRGQGFGHHAVRLAVRYAFESLNLERVHVKTDADRPDLIGFYERIGFRREGTLRSHEFIAGHRRDKAILGILRGELEQAE